MKGEKIVLNNDLYPELDIDMNGEFYEKESKDTAVIYRIENSMEGKSYIGKAYSYEKHGDQKPSRYGAKGRFRRHWSNCRSQLANNECPIFYEALRNSQLTDWFVYTIKVCSKKHLKEYETRMIKLYKTSDPKYGYNYFVGDNKPDSKEHLAKYQTAKAKSNVDRAANGQLKKNEKNKNLPPNINYRLSKSRTTGKVIGEGYFVQIKLNGKLYNKAFLSNADTMEQKLEKAKKQLEEFKKQASNGKTGIVKKSNNSGSKTGIVKKKK